jgi:hypothetical protein|tara:strand:- start:1831 stop:3126 length:1296 start_codon:yes stop_codon:yes gene_type:complete
MKMIITEKQHKSLAYEYTLGPILEQKTVMIKTVVGKEIVEGPMTEVFNELVKQKEEEILKPWRFYVTGGQEQGPGLKIENKEEGLSSKNYPFRWDTQRRRWVVSDMFPMELPVTVGGQGLFEQLNQYKDFNYFFATNTEAANKLKEQIEKMKLKLRIYPENENAAIEMYMVPNKKKNRKGERVYMRGQGIPLNNLLPLGSGKDGSGMNAAAIEPQDKNDALLKLFSGSIAARYPWLNLTAPIIEKEGEADPDPGIVAKNVSFKFEVTDPFEFDSPELSENAKEAITKEMNKIYNLKKKGLLKQYLTTKINGKKIIVDAYSSIDAASDELGGGAVKDCKPGKVTRAKYNLCLSQKRAQSVVNHLKSEFEDIFGEANLIAQGKGELESPNSMKKPWGHPDQVAHKKSKRVATQADRKFVINLPDFEATIESSD